VKTIARVEGRDVEPGEWVYIRFRRGSLVQNMFFNNAAFVAIRDVSPPDIYEEVENNEKE